MIAIMESFSHAQDLELYCYLWDVIIALIQCFIVEGCEYYSLLLEMLWDCDSVPVNGKRSQ